MDSKELALRIRRDTIEMVHAAHASHIGSVLSVAAMVSGFFMGVRKGDLEFLGE